MQRVEHVKALDRTSDLKAAELGSVAGSNASGGLEESLWLCPIEDRHDVDSALSKLAEKVSPARRTSIHGQLALTSRAAVAMTRAMRSLAMRVQSP